MRRLIGGAWALEMLIMGELMDAERALHVGFLPCLIESEELLTELFRMAEDIAALAPLASQFMGAMADFGMEGSSAVTST